MDNILRSLGLDDKIPVFKRCNITTDTFEQNYGNENQYDDQLEMIKSEAGLSTTQLIRLCGKIRELREMKKNGMAPMHSRHYQSYPATNQLGNASYGKNKRLRGLLQP
jgi:hypothetical protein